MSDNGMVSKIIDLVKNGIHLYDAIQEVADIYNLPREYVSQQVEEFLKSK